MDKKDVIIRELCKRLIHTPLLYVEEDGFITVKKVNPANIRHYIKVIKESELDYKLVLRPLSKITDEHIKKLDAITIFNIDDIKLEKVSLTGSNTLDDLSDLIEFMYENHYDITGLIRSRHAVDGVNLNILTNERFMKK